VTGFTIEAIRADGERYYTYTGGSGGYTLRVPNGIYRVYASENYLPAKSLVGEVTINSQNVKLDVMLDKRQPMRLDVDSDGVVSPLDALRIINYLNRDQALPQVAVVRDDLDVDRNGLVEISDVLMVFNELNRLPVGTVEIMSDEGNAAEFGASVPAVEAQINLAWATEEDAIRRKKRK